MNKLEYLSALKEALRDTDKDMMNEIISDYEEHFQVGMENGKSEEQICEELGKIEDLVQEIKEVYGDTGKGSAGNASGDKSRKSKEWHGGILNLDGEKIGGAINSALDSAGDAISKIDVFEIGNALKSTLDQATSSINKFTDSYFKGQGGDSEQGGRHAEGFSENVSRSYDADPEPAEAGKDHVDDGEYTEAEEAEKDPAGNDADAAGEEASDAASSSDEVTGEAAEGPAFSGVNDGEEPVETAQGEVDEEELKEDNSSKGMNLVIDGLCANVTLSRSSNQRINLDYENNGNDRQRQMYEFYSYKEGNTVYAGIRRVGKSVFLFNLKQKSIVIHAEIPENMSHVNVKTASGDIEAVDVNPDRLTVTTASGDISAARIGAADIKIKAFSGDINLESCSSVRLNADTTSGDVEVRDLDVKFLSLKSTSGDVSAGNLNADIIDSSSLSGDLDIAAIKGKECKLRSTSGDICVKEFAMSNADVSSVSGDIELPDVSGDGLSACSASGDIRVQGSLKRCHASSKSGSVEVRSKGDIALEANSISGDVHVKLGNNGGGYSLESKTTSGELHINYQDIRQRNLKSGTYTYGSQSSELALRSVSGDIRVSD